MTVDITTKMHPHLFFKPEMLNRYLKKQTTWGKLEHEIAAAIVCLHAYKDDVDGDYFVAFPPKLNKGKELNKAAGEYSLKEFERFLKAHIEEKSDIDVIIAKKDPADKKRPFMRPLQIKRFRTGGSTDDLLVWLEELAQKYPESKASLVIIAEKIGKIRLQRVVDWLNKENFPFGEVVVIGGGALSKKTVYQLKPNRGTFIPKTIDMRKATKG